MPGKGIPPNLAKGPGLKDWALFVGSMLFVVTGIVILPTNRDVGLANIAFFGLCAAVGFMTIRRKLRYRDLSGDITVQVAGGAPIRESRARALLIGGVIAALGIVMTVFGGQMGTVLRVIGAGIAVFGVVVLIGVAAGWFAAGSITFEGRGLTIAMRKWTYRVPWDNIATIGSGEYHNNPALVLGLYERTSVEVEPAASVPLVQRHFASNERWVGAPIMILPSQYAIDLPVLAQAIRRYAFDPAVRSELAQRRLP